MRVVAGLTFALCAAAASGCAHQTSFTSTPSGADVIIDGEVVGQTPLSWRQPWSGEVERQVVVQKDDASVAFTMRQRGYDMGTIGTYFAGCLGTPCAMWLGGGLFAGVGATLAGPALALPFLLIGLPIAIVGTCGWVPGLITAAVLSIFFARAGPDSVVVNLESATVTAEPPDRVALPARTAAATMRY